MRTLHFILFGFPYCLQISFVTSVFHLNKISTFENELLQESCGIKGSIDESEVQRWKRSSYSRQTNRTEAPWVVIMQTIEREIVINDTKQYLVSDCSGSLISKRHVLLAAHCFDKNLDYSNETLDIINSVIHITDCGLNCNDRNIIDIKAKQVFIPKEYFVPEKAHLSDIAIVELEKDVVGVPGFIVSVCLGGFNTLPSTVVNLYGYGEIDPEELEANVSDRARNLQTITTSILENCTYPMLATDFPDEICSRNDRDIPRPVPREGDSGAGAIVERNNRSHVVAVYKGTGTLTVATQPEILVAENELLTRVAPHLFWICHMTGVCVDNQSEHEFTAADTVLTGELEVNINGTMKIIEAYPILIKVNGINWSTSEMVPFENKLDTA